MGPRFHKKKKAANAGSAVNGGEAVCLFCKSPEDNEEKLGKKLTKQGIMIHYFCMLFASGLSQRGRSDREGVLGFLVPDIIKESKRANRLKCHYCKKHSATIGCVQSNCRAGFHFGCGIDAGALSQFFGNFSSYCYDHRPFQEVPIKEQKRYRNKHSTCHICLCQVPAKPDFDTLRTSCCKANMWYHKDCLQRMSNNSGLHFFKCPLCNNKESFQQEMLDFGVYIPDRDAQWETAPNAFQELLERHSECNAPECACPKGRSCNTKETEWEVVLCDWCGHQGTHIQCSKLKGPDSEWVCTECVEITNLATSPLLKAKLLENQNAKRDSQSAKRGRGRPRKDTSVASTERPGQKRKISTSDLAGDAKRKRLSLSDRRSSSQNLKENCNDSDSSKKTHDKAKIKSSRRSQGENGQKHNLRYYFLDSNSTGTSSGSTSDEAAQSSSSRLVETTTSAVRSLDKWLLETGQRSDPSVPLLSLAPSVDRSRKSTGKLKDDNYASDSSTSSFSSLSRAERARRRASAGPVVQPNENMPKWLKNQLKDDIFTGRNLGSKNVSMISLSDHNQSLPVETPYSRLPRSRRGSDINQMEIKQEGRPNWFKMLMNDDYLLGRNLGKKLSAESPGVHLSPGLSCRLQTTYNSPPDGATTPSGRGNDTSSFPSDHPGAVTSLGHGSTIRTQEVSASNAPLRQKMKYWDFIQHLEDIGFKHQSTIIDRLSLFQQYLEGEFELLTFADISLEPAALEERDSHSPTPSLVSPNDGEEMDLEQALSPQVSESRGRASPIAWPSDNEDTPGTCTYIDNAEPQPGTSSASSAVGAARSSQIDFQSSSVLDTHLPNTHSDTVLALSETTAKSSVPNPHSDIVLAQSETTAETLVPIEEQTIEHTQVPQYDENVERNNATIHKNDDSDSPFVDALSNLPDQHIKTTAIADAVSDNVLTDQPAQPVKILDTNENTSSSGNLPSNITNNSTNVLGVGESKTDNQDSDGDLFSDVDDETEDKPELTDSQAEQLLADTQTPVQNSEESTEPLPQTQDGLGDEKSQGTEKPVQNSEESTEPLEETQPDDQMDGEMAQERDSEEIMDYPNSEPVSEDEPGDSQNDILGDSEPVEETGQIVKETTGETSKSIAEPESNAIVSGEEPAVNASDSDNEEFLSSQSSLREGDEAESKAPEKSGKVFGRQLSNESVISGKSVCPPGLGVDFGDSDSEFILNDAVTESQDSVQHLDTNVEGPVNHSQESQDSVQSLSPKASDSIAEIQSQDSVQCSGPKASDSITELQKMDTEDIREVPSSQESILCMDSVIQDNTPSDVTKSDQLKQASAKQTTSADLDSDIEDMDIEHIEADDDTTATENTGADETTAPQTSRDNSQQNTSSKEKQTPPIIKLEIVEIDSQESDLEELDDYKKTFIFKPQVSSLKVSDKGAVVVEDSGPTVAQQDALQVDIEEILTVPKTESVPRANWGPAVVDIEEISTGQKDLPLIDLTSDDASDSIILNSAASRVKKPGCCGNCGKKKKLLRPFNSLDQNTFITKDVRQLQHTVIEID